MSWTLVALPGKLVGGVVTLVVEGEPLIVHARVLADLLYFAAQFFVGMKAQNLFD